MKEVPKNLETWDKLRSVPREFQKKITGGRLKGLTEVRPQWRYQKLTEEFGPCGQGWKFEYIKIWTSEGGNNEIVQNVSLNFFYKINSKEWSAPIPGVGGSKLVAKESGGLYTSDEAVKMATTDALGTAMKMIGLAADIHMGHLDGKYEITTPEPPRELNEEQLKKLKALSPELQKQIKQSKKFHGATDIYDFMESVKWSENDAFMKLDPDYKKETAAAQKKEKLNELLPDLKEMLKKSAMTTTDEMYDFMESVKWNQTDAMDKLNEMVADQTGFEESIQNTGGQ